MISEAAVIAVAVALYLFDCIVLLERGQALWSRADLSFGSTQYQVRGKVVALLNPLTPFFPAFRTAPLFSQSHGPRASRVVRAVQPLSVFALMQFVLLFVALPYCLHRAPGWPFLVSLVLAYVNAIAMLGILWWRFRRAGFATRPLLGLGFAWLACLPLSVNALRRAGLAFDVSVDAPRALRFVAAEERQGAHAGLAGQVAEAMQELDEGDPLHGRLADLQRQLAPGATHERI